MNKQVTVEEFEEHLRERLEDVRNGQTVTILDGTNPIAVIEPASVQSVDLIRHDPSLRLQDFKRRPPLRDTGAVEWLIGERERDRSGKKHS